MLWENLRLVIAIDKFIASSERAMPFDVLTQSSKAAGSQREGTITRIPIMGEQESRLQKSVELFENLA
jgi:hypothetical protein